MLPFRRFFYQFIQGNSLGDLGDPHAVKKFRGIHRFQIAVNITIQMPTVPDVGAEPGLCPCPGICLAVGKGNCMTEFFAVNFPVILKNGIFRRNLPLHPSLPLA